jgi:hypothetical protein
MFKSLVWFSMVVGMSSFAESTGRIFFTNECDDNPTAVDTPCGTRVHYELRGLELEVPYEIVIEIFPTGKSAQVFKRQIYQSEVSKDGSWFLKKKLNLSDRYGNPPDFSVLGRLWSFNVRWRKSQGDDLFKAALSNFFVASSDTREYFYVKHLDKDQKVCTWRRPVEIQSGYLFNSDAFDMEVSQEVDVRPLTYANGFTTGLRLPIESQESVTPSPLFEDSSSHKRWFIAKMSEVFGYMGNRNIKLNKSLPQNQGGFFIKKVIYSRYKAYKYELENQSSFFRSHYQWKNPESGFVDIPETLYDFAFVPQSEVSSLSRAIEFIESTTVPTESNCDDKGGLSLERAEVVKGSSPAFQMYFLIDR